MTLRRVKKRDGREVPFDKSKISDAVARAQAAVGELDPTFPGEVADVVELALRRRHGEPRQAGAVREIVPTIEEIQDLVEQALIELGRAAVAKAYILYRDRRARIRGVLRVRDDATSTSSVAGRAPDDAVAGATAARPARVPRVQMSSGVETWTKGRIVVALMNEADLPRSTAEEVAARVEERVFDTGLVRISTALIRELVDNELVEMGFAQALRRQRSVGLPRHDLRRHLGDPSASSEGLPLAPSVEPHARPGASATLGAEILRRYVLEDVLPERLAEMHLCGDLMLENVGSPHLAQTRALPCELYLRGAPLPRSAFELLDVVASESARVARTLVLEDVPALFQCLNKAPRPTRLSLNFLLALSATMRASGRRVDLCLSSGGPILRGASAFASNDESEGGAASGGSSHAPTWLARLLEDLALLSSESASFRAPRVYMDGDDLALLASESPARRGELEQLLAAEILVPAWGSAGERFVGPGLVRAHGERGVLTCFGAVALNLPRAARRAGAWREDQLFEELLRLVESALDIAAALAEFQRTYGGASAQHAGRGSFALVPVGLREALRWLADGELLPEEAGRVLAFLSEAAQRCGHARGIVATLTPFFGERARARFAALDSELYPLVQPTLFDDAPERASARGEPYSTGFDLAGARAQSEPFTAGRSLLGAGAAAIAATQRSGAFHPIAMVGARAGSGADAPTLDAWLWIERSRSRLRAGGFALYALPHARPPTDPDQVELPYDRGPELVRAGASEPAPHDDSDP